MSAATALQPVSAEVVATKKYGNATITERKGGLVHITCESYPEPEGGVWVKQKDLAPATAVTERSLKIQATPLSELQQSALELWSKDQASAKELGTALIAVREKMFHAGRGAFTVWYRENNLSENRVNYCIRLAEGKGKKSGKAVATRPSVQFEKAVADAVRSTLQVYTHQRTNTLKLDPDSMETLLVQVFGAIYHECSTCGIVPDFDNLNPDIQNLWFAARSSLSNFLSAAYVTPEPTAEKEKR